MLDLDAGRAEFKRVDYEIERTQAEIRKLGLPEQLAATALARPLNAERSGISYAGGGDGLAPAADLDALLLERLLNLVARLEDAPLDGRQRHLERVGDLVVGEPGDIAQQQRLLEIGAQLLDRPPEHCDRLAQLDRRVHAPRAGERPRSPSATRGRRSSERNSSTTRFFAI